MHLVTAAQDSAIFWIVVLSLAAAALVVIRAMDANEGFRRKRDEARRTWVPEQRRAWAAHLGERSKAERL